MRDDVDDTDGMTEGQLADYLAAQEAEGEPTTRLDPEALLEALVTWEQADEAYTEKIEQAEEAGHDLRPDDYYYHDDAGVAFAQTIAPHVRELLRPHLEHEIHKWVFTFGYAHTEQHRDLGLGELDKGYVVVEAPTRDLARRIGKAIFGVEHRPGGGETWQWAFDYEYDDFIGDAAEAYPAGELLRIGWLRR